MPVLAPGAGRTKTGRLWTYVRDDRPAGSVDPPAVWFAYSPDRKGEHPHAHLKSFTGVLQANAYAGFNKLYLDGSIRQAPMSTERQVYNLKVDPSGRIVLPAQTRERLHIAGGDTVIIVEDECGVHLKTRKQLLAEAQAFFATIAPPDVMLSEEILQDRRSEAERD